MHYAATIGHTDVVNMLASLPGINVNAAANDGWTPIHYAERYVHTDVFNALTSLPNINANVPDNTTRVVRFLTAISHELQQRMLRFFVQSL